MRWRKVTTKNPVPSKGRYIGVWWCPPSAMDSEGVRSPAEWYEALITDGWSDQDDEPTMIFGPIPEPPDPTKFRTDLP